MSTLRVSNIEAKADASSPTIDEKVKITNSQGRVLMHVDGKTSGITTVGINTTGNTFTVSGNNVTFSGSVTSSGVSTFSSGIVVAAGSTAAPSISPSGDSNTGIFFPAPDTVAIGEGGIEALRVNSSGGVQIANGNLIFSTAGTGIDFSATANSSGTMTSELLADYEEGTWTPTLTYATPGSSSFSYSYNTGWYCKVGTLVHVTWDIRLSAFTKGTASGNPQVAGFPFTTINTANYGRANSFVFLYQWPYQTSAGNIPVVSVQQTLSTVADLSVTVSNGVSVALNDPDADSMIFGALTYRSAT